MTSDVSHPKLKAAKALSRVARTCSGRRTGISTSNRAIRLATCSISHGPSEKAQAELVLSKRAQELPKSGRWTRVAYAS